MPITSIRTTSIAVVVILGGCGDGSADFRPPGGPPPGQPPGEPPPIAAELVFPNLAFIDPLYMLQAPGDSSRWFVVEKDGFVLDFANDDNVDEVFEFADLTAAVDSTAGESGLLGMAFHPDFQANGEVFLSYTRTGPGGGIPFESVVSRFIADPETLVFDPDTEEILLTVGQPFGNHNGGNIAFGPDDFLYIGFGDGGGSGDPGGNGQDTTNVLGTILRIDVDGADPYAIPADNPFAGNTDCRTGAGTADCPEIFAWGFRNPWRFSFDRDTGELWVADVGQNTWEEVNRVQISENYGWNHREGAHCFDPPEDCSTDNVDPITEYSHDVGSSITGGYVYRGNDFPDLVGFYLFGDFVSGRIWSVPFNSEQGTEPEELLDTPIRISSFAESNEGELYVLHFNNGTIHRIVAD
jgi:glucose/arabinose dehydrogenase